jgi:UDP-2,3-diacylglucosamine pyrophosphatase LpxH
MKLKWPIARTCQCLFNVLRSPRQDQGCGMVDDEIRRHIDRGVDVVVCGHAHEPQDRPLGTGRLLVLDNWEDAGDAVVYDAGRWERLVVD